jgi:hypothetical protein
MFLSRLASDLEPPTSTAQVAGLQGSTSMSGLQKMGSFFFFMILGFELKALLLLGRCSTT